MIAGTAGADVNCEASVSLPQGKLWLQQSEKSLSLVCVCKGLGDFYLGAFYEIRYVHKTPFPVIIALRLNPRNKRF